MTVTTKLLLLKFAQLKMLYLDTQLALKKSNQTLKKYCNLGQCVVAFELQYH